MKFYIPVLFLLTKSWCLQQNLHAQCITRPKKRHMCEISALKLADSSKQGVKLFQKFQESAVNHRNYDTCFNIKMKNA